jgi:sulfite exporter TauE/SafE
VHAGNRQRGRRLARLLARPPLRQRAPAAAVDAQSMQIYAISTGNFYAGAKIMLFFALGTLPVLLLLSFGINFLHTPKAKNIFFKTAGLVVMIFGIINLLNSLAVIGLIKPILIF